LSRAIRLRVVVPVPPPTAVKIPPITIFPSGWIVIAMTSLFAPGLNDVSTEPSPFSRAIRLRVVFPKPPPPTFVNDPPTRIFPSGWTAIARTELFAPGSKLSTVVWACATPHIPRKAQIAATARPRIDVGPMEFSPEKWLSD
jgi:hypothetical protein